jgi:hypothetical protein
MIWQGNVQKAYMFTNPRAKDFPAKHKLWKNNQKIIDRKCDIMQKTTYFLDHYSIIYEFLKM